MKVMVFVKATASSEAGKMPDEALITAMMQYNQQLLDAGILLGGDGLHPSKNGARVRFSGDSRTVIQGPFPHTEEIVAGYWLWQVNSMEEAIEWVKRCPNPMPEDSEIEIRPIFGPEDFAEVMTPELQQREEQMRNQVPEPDRWEKKPARLFAGIERHYTEQNRYQIPEQWQVFAPYIGHVPDQTGTDSFGICTGCSDGGVDYMSAVEIRSADQLPDGLVSRTLPAAHYAVFIHREHVSRVGETLHAIGQKWLPASGLQADGSPWFERYTAAFDPETGLGGTEVWVPIKTL